MKETNIPRAYDWQSYGDQGSGKVWPHGERPELRDTPPVSPLLPACDEPGALREPPFRFRPPLSPQMRSLLESSRLDSWQDGYDVGRDERDSVIPLVLLSMMGGAFALWVIQRVIA